MSEKLIIPDEVVISKIYYIRDQKVMLDSDLAELYEVETRVLNQQVKRNLDRFPEDFMFQLTDNEWENLRSQNAMSSWGGRRTVDHPPDGDLHDHRSGGFCRAHLCHFPAGGGGIIFY